MSKFYKAEIDFGYGPCRLAGRVLNDKEVLIYSEDSKVARVEDLEGFLRVAEPCTQEEFEQTIREMR